MARRKWRLTLCPKCGSEVYYIPYKPLSQSTSSLLKQGIVFTGWLTCSNCHTEFKLLTLDDFFGGYVKKFGYSIL